MTPRNPIIKPNLSGYLRIWWNRKRGRQLVHCRHCEGFGCYKCYGPWWQTPIREHNIND